MRVAVLDPSNDVVTRRIIDRMDASEYFTVICRLHSPADMEASFGRGEIDMALVFSERFSDKLYTGEARVQLVSDATDPNMATMQAGYAANIISSAGQEMLPPGVHAAAIVPQLKLLYNPQMKSAYNFVPGVMGLILMLICAMMTSISIVREKETGTMEVLLVSPVKPLFIILAKAVPYFVLSFVNLTTILLSFGLCARCSVAAACLAVVIAGAVWGSRDGASDKSKPPGSGSNQISDSRQIASADSYDEIYEYIERYQKEVGTKEFVTSDSEAKTMESAAQDSAAGNASASPNAGARASDAGAAHGESAGYSQTNVRQKGVDEGDVVKTDGKYLYVLKDSRQEVSIVKADGKDMEEIGSIKADDASQIQEIYLQPDSGKLVLVCSRFDALEDEDYPSGRGLL